MAAEPAGAASGLETFKLSDGRRLAYHVYGAPLQGAAQRAVLYFHGVPSCHMEAEALHGAAKALGLPVVSMDRAGIGLSDFKCWRGLATTADDARQLAQHLALQRLVLVGTSGGGPYAAAFAALHPRGVEALVLVSAVGPTDWAHLPLLRAMHGADFLQLGLVRLPPLGGLWALHSLLGYMAKHHTQTLLEHAPKGMAAADAQVLRSDPAVRRAFGACLQHAYCRGARGMARDVRVLGGKWGVPVSDIQCRVMIWQGDQDRSVPVAHAQWWVQQVPGSQLTVLPGEGHVTVLLRHAATILESAVHGASPQQQQEVAQQPPG